MAVATVSHGYHFIQIEHIGDNLRSGPSEGAGAMPGASVQLALKSLVAPSDAAVGVGP